MRSLSKRWYTIAACLAAAALMTADASANPQCFDRDTHPYTAVIDTHLHFRPFGGQAIPFTELLDYLEKTGVKFVNAYGIGQTLPIDSDCRYYLDCPGTLVAPSLRNDFVNAANVIEHKPKGIHVTLSMTFPDLASPDSVLDQVHLLDKEFPGLFRWMGEVNLVKQALFNNHHQATPAAAIERWGPFMTVLRERGVPITIHSDLGNDAEPMKYVHLMEEVLRQYPDNKIVWAHMGLSKELTTMDPAVHIKMMREFLDSHKNLTLDISWRVLYDSYFSKAEIRDRYVRFFNEYSPRILPGSDFVASRNKRFNVYREELDVTSRINQYLDDEAFRNIALGENYFRLLGLNIQAPKVCRARSDSASAATVASRHTQPGGVTSSRKHAGPTTTSGQWSIPRTEPR